MRSDIKSFFIVSSEYGSTASPMASGLGKSYHSAIIGTRLIISGIEHCSIPALVRAAEIAFAWRDIARIEAAACDLLALQDNEALAAGLFYLGVVAKRQGRLSEAVALFEQVADGPSQKFKARAIQALGIIRQEQGDYETAFSKYLQAAKHARESDLLTLFYANSQISTIASEHSDHRRALDDLAALSPLVRLIATKHPQVFYHFHSDLAFELAQTGQVKKALEHSQIAVRASFIKAYPEWQENKKEIHERAQEVEHKLIITIIQKPEPRPKPVAIVSVPIICFHSPKSYNDLRGSIYLARAPVSTLQLERIKYSITRRGPPQFSTS